MLEEFLVNILGPIITTVLIACLASAFVGYILISIFFRFIKELDE